MKKGIIFFGIFLLVLQGVYSVNICDVDVGEWSEWGEWGDCVNGNQTRSRTELNSGCIEEEFQECVPGSCVNECFEDGKILGVCKGNVASRIVCGDNDGDGCLEWSNKITEECGIGMFCQRAECVGELCQDECSFEEQQKTCLGEKISGIKICGNYDDDVCYEWGDQNIIECLEGEICRAGNCGSEFGNWVCKEWGDCVDKTQTRECVDVEGLSSSTTESRECISGVELNYYPEELNLIVAKDYEIDFRVDSNVKNFEINWFLNSELKEKDESFSFVFEEDSELKAEINVEGKVQELIWKIKINEEAKENCVPKWRCDWSDCSDEEDFSFSYNCFDVNSCGVNVGKLIKKNCECYSNWECGDWSKCNAKYDFSNFLEDETSVKGYFEKVCVDLSGCKSEKIQRKVCSVPILINANKTSWCDSDFVEIFDSENGNLVSRIKKTEISSDLNRVDISFLGDSEKGYCDYCFDGLQNYDELGVDCGGLSCPECEEFIEEEFVDWLPKFVFWWWIFLGVLVLGFLFIERENIFSSVGIMKEWEDSLEKKINGVFKN
jgi:hypothetical protein